jgi:CMP-N,N'-diacetyllegionaminic acid synthase
MFDSEKQHIISIIPARGGSKGILHKNIALLNGIPLIDYTIKASLGSSYIRGTYVTSDSDDILSVAQKTGAAVIKRPAPLATDTARSESAIMHAINFIQSEEGSCPDVIILLQPTSPLRDSEDIDRAFECFFSSNADALISGIEPAINPLKQMLVGEDGMLKTLTEDRTTPFQARQLLPRAFQPNGAIYIIRAELFMKTGLLIGGRTMPFYMDETKSLDIDTPADLEEAARLLAEKSYILGAENIRPCGCFEPMKDSR